VRVLFDQGTPLPLQESLKGHKVRTAHELGWSTLSNGDVLDAAEKEGFEVVVTTDTHLKNQLSLKSRRIGIVVLSTPSWRRINVHCGPLFRRWKVRPQVSTTK
jgi:hypothetical protein